LIPNVLVVQKFITIIAQSISGLHEEMKEIVVENTKSQFAIKALDMIFESPIFTTPNFIRLSGIPKAGAMRIINILKEKVILKILREARGRRIKVTPAF